MTPRVRILVLACVCAPQARADCNVAPLSPQAVFDVVELPRNAELRFVWRFPEALSLTLGLPDGTAVEVPVVDDDRGPVARLPEELSPLPVGAFSFQMENGPAGTFVVVDEVDDEPPAAPTSASIDADTRVPVPTFGLFDDCPQTSGPWLTIAVPAQAGDIVLLDGVAVTGALADGVVRLEMPGEGGAHDVALRDVAGNESEAVAVGDGGGCAAVNVDACTIVGLFALAAARRRARVTR